MTAPAAIGRLDGEPVDLWIEGSADRRAAVIVIRIREDNGHRLEGTLALNASQALAFARQITEAARAATIAARVGAIATARATTRSRSPRTSSIWTGPTTPASHPSRAGSGWATTAAMAA